MAKLVFDIETVGLPLETFDETQQDYLLRGADTDEAREQKIREFNLTPFTARVCCIGMLNVDTGKGRVIYLADEAAEETIDGVAYVALTDEHSLLTKFWEVIGATKETQSREMVYDKFITFNGRGFDCPFVMLRSAQLGIRPTRNLMAGGKFAGRKAHIDLMDELTFLAYGNSGATRRFNLDFYCKSFGIDSPKGQEVTGRNINEVFAAKRFHEIAEYCMRDVKATSALYSKWQTMLWFPNE